MDNVGTTFYYNATFSDAGTYSYFIWANDTSNNIDFSVSDTFEIPPNWDIFIDHDCNIFDLVQIANHFDETGPGGWIREDVDNNGDIQVFDLVLVANYFDDTW